MRLFLRRGLSVRYLLPAPVVEYIEDHELYLEESSVSVGGSEKERDLSGSPKKEGEKA